MGPRGGDGISCASCMQKVWEGRDGDDDKRSVALCSSRRHDEPDANIDTEDTAALWVAITTASAAFVHLPGMEKARETPRRDSVEHWSYGITSMVEGAAAACILAWFSRFPFFFITPRLAGISPSPPSRCTSTTGLCPGTVGQSRQRGNLHLV